MSENEALHVKVTINDLYKEQQETNKLLIQLAAQLNNLADLPDRVRAVEKHQDENAWVPKLIWVTLTTSAMAFIGALYKIITG